jgi:signal transduction histidine kinase
VYANGTTPNDAGTCTFRIVGAQGRRPRWSRSQWSDVALAVGAFAISASVLTTHQRWSPGPAAWALVAVHAAPVAFRRTSPRAAFAVSAAAGAAYLAPGWPMVGLGLAALVMTYSLAAYTSRRDSLVGLAAVEAVLTASALLGTDPQVDTLVGNLLVVAAAWVLGDGARRRREDALSEQRRLAEQAVVDERLRIARELHDVVAHSMSVIAVQAGTGRVVIDDDVDHAPPGPRVHRGDEQRGAGGDAPAPGRAAGGDVGRRGRPCPGADARRPRPARRPCRRRWHTRRRAGGGRPAGCAGGIELAAYRVLQEALTNVRRHAPGARACVRVTFEPRELVIEVENRLGDGKATSQRGGHGLIGMRERVSLYGGTFDAGPRPDGTFQVSARIPYQTGDGPA